MSAAEGSFAGPPSPWVARFAPLAPRTGPVLDLACGGGRHLRHFLALGHAVVGIDRDTRGVADLAGRPGCTIVAADLEDGGPWPLGEQRFGAVIVTNYLHRPLLPRLPSLLLPGGLLLYETFAQGNQRFGRPAGADHLLRSGELLAMAQGRLQIVAYEHGEIASPKAAVVQRLAAVHDLTPAATLCGDPEPRPLPTA